MHDLSEQKTVRSLVHNLQSDRLRWAEEAAQILVSLLSLFLCQQSCRSTSLLTYFSFFIFCVFFLLWL